MHTIKFRGKSHDNEGKIEGEWIYGFLAAPDQIMVWNEDNATGQMFQVYPETVGQFVCLDKNKDEVYAGDWYKGRLHADNRAKRQVVWYRLAWRGRLPNCPTDIVEYGTIEPNNIELIKD